VTSTAPALRIEPLSDQHDRESFNSGVEPLDRYLQQQAGQDARRRVASCFVLVNDGDRVPIGYYTLAATSIALAELPEPPGDAAATLSGRARDADGTAGG
jgi:hypothetical protein